MNAPKQLTDLTGWFAGNISQPLTGKRKELDADTHIRVQGNLSPKRRLEIYNRGYWGKISRFLTGRYPLLEDLYGKEKFQQELANPFLFKHHPFNRDLTKLELFPAWVKDLNPLHTQALEIDRALSTPREEIEPLLFKNINDLLDQELTLTASLFECPANLFEYRKALIKEKPIELEQGQFYYALGRIGKSISFQSLDSPQYLFLKAFEKGATLNIALQGRNSNPFEVQEWFETFADWGWITTRKTT